MSLQEQLHAMSQAELEAMMRDQLTGAKNNASMPRLLGQQVRAANDELAGAIKGIDMAQHDQERLANVITCIKANQKVLELVINALSS